MLDNKIFESYIKKYFYNEVKTLDKVLIIPLGIAVEEVLLKLVDEGIISDRQCLFGFPHPTGANGRRKSQFVDRKNSLKTRLAIYFNDKK